MSRISFQDERGVAEVGGRERAQCGWILKQLFEAIVDLRGMMSFGEEARIGSALGDFARHPNLALMSTSGGTVIAGRNWDMFQLQLNTAMVLGGDHLRLVARVHGQCEIHGYVEGPDRAWFAGIVERALAARVLREETQNYGKGWRDVIELLRARAGSPVVMSYSVCDGFPNRQGTQFDGADDDGKLDDAWGALSEKKRWRLAMAALRARNGLLRIEPETWESFRTGDGEDAYDLIESLQKWQGGPKTWEQKQASAEGQRQRGEPDCG